MTRVMTRADAIGAGIGPELIRSRLRTGHWRSLHRGVFLCCGGEAGPWDRAQASVLAFRSDTATASHDTAAAAYGLDVVRRSPRDHVTVPRALRSRRSATLCVHYRDLSGHDRVLWRGIHLTGVARTAYDMLLDADQLSGVWLCEQAIRCGLVTSDALIAMTATYPDGPGHARARARLRLVDARSESPLETAARLLLAMADLPTPEVQIPVRDVASGIVFRIDLGYAAARIGIELDGRAVHGTAAAVLADRRRQNALHLAGWTILRFTWEDVMYRPAYVIATVRRALLRTSA